jgi:hypothetical protein
LEFLARAIKQEKEVKVIQIGKEIKSSLFANGVTLYLQDSKKSNKKLLDLLKTFSSIAGYKNNIQKSIDFLYTNNEQVRKELRKIIPFTIN